jgi:WD40 repeat protein
MTRCLIAFLLTATLSGADPSFRRDVFPLFRDNCLACHSAQTKMGQLVMEDYDGLMKGGKTGPALVAGNAESSLLVRMLEGRAQPKMPFGGGDLPAKNIATIRAWIDAGAKGEAVTSATPSLPDIAGNATTTPISALAFSPDGAWLAVGDYQQVHIFSGKDKRLARTLAGHADLVRALAFSPDGKLLAAAGGAPAQFGEVKVWDVATGKLRHTIKGHKDCIYSADFSPDGKQVGTASYDRMIELWNAETGDHIRTLKDHVDAVYAVDFGNSPGHLLSGGADRSVKLWNLETGKPSLTLSEPLSGVLSVAFHPDGRTFAAAGADKTIRVWRIANDENSAADLVKAMTGHEGAILKIAYSPDGTTIVSTSSDRSLKVWDSETLAEKAVLSDQSDWAQALAFHPDGKSFVVGRYDGSLTSYDAVSLQPTSGWKRAASRPNLAGR